MEEILMVSILPALLVYTSFLFNIGMYEIVEFKYGITKDHFKMTAYVAILIYVVYAGACAIILNKTSYFRLGLLKQLVFIIVLYIIHHIVIKKFRNKRDQIFLKKDKYERLEHKCKFWTNISFGLICILSTTTIVISWAELKLVADMLFVASQEIDYFFIIIMLFTHFICYSLIIATTGYIFNYGQLFNFKKYKIIFDDNIKEILDKLEIEYNQDQGSIGAYILIETKDEVIVKFSEVEFQRVIFQRENILNILFSDEEELALSQSINQ